LRRDIFASISLCINTPLRNGLLRKDFMTATRKLAAILAADVVGFSRLAGADEDRTLARLRALRSDLIDPTIDVPHGATVVRLRSDEPKADQHQHAGQGGEQEAIGNAGRQAATD
jgi:class 3 adenylate cyclase